MDEASPVLWGERELDRDCVHLNGERIINGCEIGCPSDKKTVQIALVLRDEFDLKFMGSKP